MLNNPSYLHHGARDVMPCRPFTTVLLPSERIPWSWSQVVLRCWLIVGSNGNLGRHNFHCSATSTLRINGREIVIFKRASLVKGKKAYSLNKKRISAEFIFLLKCQSIRWNALLLLDVKSVNSLLYCSHLFAKHNYG